MSIKSEGSESRINQLDLKELDVFVQPIGEFIVEESILLEQPLAEGTHKHGVGFVVGRFQPLHRGHLYLMRQALRVAELLIIGIGSSNVINVDNPFSIEKRQELLKRALEREADIYRYIKMIVPIPDYPDDQLWLQETLRQIGRVDVVIGNNDWVNRIFRGASYPAIEVPLFRRDFYEGKTIRKELRRVNKL